MWTFLWLWIHTPTSNIRALLSHCTFANTSFWFKSLPFWWGRERSCVLLLFEVILTLASRGEGRAQSRLREVLVGPSPSSSSGVWSAEGLTQRLPCCNPCRLWPKTQDMSPEDRWLPETLFVPGCTQTAAPLWNRCPHLKKSPARGDSTFNLHKRWNMVRWDVRVKFFWQMPSNLGLYYRLLEEYKLVQPFWRATW